MRKEFRVPGGDDGEKLRPKQRHAHTAMTGKRAQSPSEEGRNVDSFEATLIPCSNEQQL